ncbi:FadR/GntR family transcriptional regulator [Sphingobium sp. YR768]|uniref:FadR/GntR family transcriptional regulator n=1 Tax=Sphingobium sp. YR768 TaxID=1884365 RepID=UPI003527BD70
MWLQLRPLGVGQYEAIHPEYEAHRSTNGNPESTQSLVHKPTSPISANPQVGCARIGFACVRSSACQKSQPILDQIKISCMTIWQGNLLVGLPYDISEAMTVRKKLYQNVAQRIEQDIEDGIYPKGTRLPPERELAEQFDVSRPTVREAIIALEIRNLVEVKHGSGVYVLGSSSTDGTAAELDVGAFELIEARIMFEGEAAALAAIVMTDSELRRLGGILSKMESVDPISADELALDRQFHLAIAQGTRNSLVEQSIEQLWDLRDTSPLCRHMFAQARQSGITPRPHEHRRIFDALEARDADLARAAMRDHLRRVSEDLLIVTELELIEKAKQDIVDKRRRLGANSKFVA